MIDKKLGYSPKTQKLIERMCKNVERKDFTLNKKKAEECLLKTYDLFKLKRPSKIVWFNDIFNERYLEILRSAWSALDYDFDFFVFGYEYNENPSDEKPNDNDKKYLAYSELLMKAKEYGMGYRVEFEDTLYCVPTPIVSIDEQNRFHSLTKPAMYWKDGKKFYYLHGVKLEKEWFDKIRKDELTAEEVFSIDNTEHRRIAYEFMDKKKLLALKDYKILDEVIDEKGKPMKVFSFKVKNVSEPIKIYQCVDASTDRQYHLGTNKDTCKEAKSEFWGFTSDEVVFKNEW